MKTQKGSEADWNLVPLMTTTSRIHTPESFHLILTLGSAMWQVLAKNVAKTCHMAKPMLSLCIGFVLIEYTFLEPSHCAKSKPKQPWGESHMEEAEECWFTATAELSAGGHYELPAIKVRRFWTFHPFQCSHWQPVKKNCQTIHRHVKN